MPTKEKPDAIALLKADHRKVAGLFDKFEAAKSDAAKQALAKEICTELCVHTMIEEEIFYPACREGVEEDQMDEAYVEHDGAKVLINDIMAGGTNDEFYDAKVKVLSEDIEHHVKEEEQRGEGMFAQARAAEVDLVALRDQMLARKEQLMAQLESEGLPPAQLSAVNAMPAAN